MSSQKVKDIILIILFLAGITFPLGDTIFGLDPTILNENRVLASLPEFKIDMSLLSTYPKDFESFYNDHFGFRRTLIWGRSLVMVKLLGVSPNSDVIVGKDGWLFYGDKKVLDYYRAIDPFTEDELVIWQHSLEARRDWLAERGSRYLLVIAPNKDTVYPEFMPDQITKVGAESRLDQLVNYLQAHSNIEFLDLRNVLLHAKGTHPVYYRTDSHWNQLGAFTASQEITKRLAIWYPQLHPRSVSDFDVAVENIPGGDLAGMISLKSLLHDEAIEFVNLPLAARPAVPLIPLPDLPEHFQPVAKEQPVATFPNAILVGDSFSIGLMPFLAENFKRSVYYNENYLTQEIFESIIELERPDVVVHEIVDRRFQDPLMPVILQMPVEIPPDISPTYRVLPFLSWQDLAVLGDEGNLGATGLDPAAKFNVALPAAQIPGLRIQLRMSPLNVEGQPTSHQASVYYRRSDQPEFVAEQRLDFVAVADGQLHTYYLEAPVTSQATGTIAEIRVDPIQDLSAATQSLLRVDFLSAAVRLDRQVCHPLDDLYHWYTYDLAILPTPPQNHSVDELGLQALVTGPDSQLNLALDDIPFEAETVDTLSVQLKGQLVENLPVTVNSGIYFRGPDQNLDEAHSIKFQWTADGTSHQIQIDLQSNPYWRGPISWLRLDPVDYTNPSVSVLQFNLERVKFSNTDKFVCPW